MIDEQRRPAPKPARRFRVTAKYYFAGRPAAVARRAAPIFGACLRAVSTARLRGPPLPRGSPGDHDRCQMWAQALSKPPFGRGRGGTGRRAGLKIRYRKVCRFDSDLGHQTSESRMGARALLNGSRSFG